MIFAPKMQKTWNFTKTMIFTKYWFLRKVRILWNSRLFAEKCTFRVFASQNHQYSLCYGRFFAFGPSWGENSINPEIPHFSPKNWLCAKITIFMKILIFGKKCAGRGNSSVAQRFWWFGRQKREKCIFDENHQKVRIFTLFTFLHPIVTAFRKKQKICTFLTFAPPRAPPQSATHSLTETRPGGRPPRPRRKFLSRGRAAAPPHSNKCMLMEGTVKGMKNLVKGE